MSTGNQIEPFERPYQIVYGEDGGEQRPVPSAGGTEWPLWRARRMVIALIAAQIAKTDDPAEREQLAAAKQAFLTASTGEIVFGMIRRWKNRKGKTRFIGMVEKGQDYRKAGENPFPSKSFRPSQHHPVSVSDNDHLRYGVETKTAKPVTPPPMSEAERIADKMAKASRKAVDPDQNSNTAP
jgi:hypothetical protein